MVIARSFVSSLVFVLMCGIGAASCSGFHTRPSSVDAGLRAAAVEQRQWSEQRLGWGDFRGGPPASGPDAATVYAITWSLRCTADGLDADAVANFFPRLSWVKTSVLLDANASRRLLGHERAHFDLAEIYARTMRRYFATAPQPCGRGGVDLMARAREFERGCLLMQSRYDDETYNGRDSLVQEVWEDSVERSLALLEPFRSRIDTRYWIRAR